MTTAKAYLEQKKFQQPIVRPNLGFGATGGGAGEFKSIGQLFTESQAYKSFITNGQNQSDNVAIPSLSKQRLPFATKANLTSIGADGALLRDYPIVPPAQVPLTIRDLMNVQGTNANAIPYIRETGYTNASTLVGETLLKPESGITFETETALVRVIAHFLPVTKQILDDIPSMSNYIDQRLIYGLATTEEAQLLWGDGTGENLLGLMVDTGAQTRNAPAGEFRIDTIRRAMTLAYLAGFPATGIVLHPDDLETIELTKSTTNEYIFADLSNGDTLTNGTTPRLFGVPIVQSIHMTAGSYLVGSFGLASQIWEREQANVRISDSHADFFTRNMKAVLCEERIAMTTVRPEAFVRGTFATA
jgi:HK97 family phage major capsid protein